MISFTSFLSADPIDFLPNLQAKHCSWFHCTYPFFWDKGYYKIEWNVSLIPNNGSVIEHFNLQKNEAVLLDPIRQVANL